MRPDLVDRTPLDHARFAVLILTHGRPDNVITTRALEHAGYTGRIVYVIDDEDKRGDEYRARFGADNVVEFSKAAIEPTFDIGDTLDDRRAVVYARNAAYQIARDLGLDYFLELDDDYNVFRHRWLNADRVTLGSAHIASMDDIIEAMLTFLDESGAATVALSQAGDHLGGTYMRKHKGVLRKAMNAFFFRVDRPVEFLGRINEDATAYVVHGARGDLFFTVLALDLIQLLTQSNPGGLTDIYLASGTYVKSFYTVMMAPSCVRVELMHTAQPRYHHRIAWDKAVPKILAPHHRKPRDRATG
jgi:hypothetical protein